MAAQKGHYDKTVCLIRLCMPSCTGDVSSLLRVLSVEELLVFPSRTGYQAKELLVPLVTHIGKNRANDLGTSAISSESSKTAVGTGSCRKKSQQDSFNYLTSEANGGKIRRKQKGGNKSWMD